MSIPACIAPAARHRLRLLRSLAKENTFGAFFLLTHFTEPLLLAQKIWFSRQVPEQEKTSPKGLVFSWLTVADELRTASFEYDKNKLSMVKILLRTA